MDVLRAACARPVLHRLRRLRGPGPAASPAAWGRRPAPLFCAAPCGALALAGLVGMFPDCDARQERDGLVRGAAAVLGCSLAAVAARTGGATKGANDERNAAGSPPARRPRRKHRNISRERRTESRWLAALAALSDCAADALAGRALGGLAGI